MIFLLFGFITWRLVLEMVFLWSIAGVTYMPNKVWPHKVSQKTRTLLFLAGLALVALLRSPVVGLSHTPTPKNYVASAYERYAPSFDAPAPAEESEVGSAADSASNSATVAPAKPETSSEMAGETPSGRKLWSAAYRPLERHWKKASSFKDNYKRTTVDAAWTSAVLNPGDGLCIEGDGYAGFDYPEGPPSFIVNIKNKQSDRLVHFNPRRGQNIIVVNHMLNKKWGTESV